jgi:hypothetical protein
MLTSRFEQQSGTFQSLKKPNTLMKVINNLCLAGDKRKDEASLKKQPITKK